MAALRNQLLLVAAFFFLSTSFATLGKSVEGSNGSLKVVAPSGGEIWLVGTQHKIIWKYNGFCSSHVAIELLKGDTVDRKIVARTWIGNSGNSIRWTIPDDQLQGDYAVRITSLGLGKGACVGTSGSFAITALTVDKTSDEMVKKARAAIQEVSAYDVKKMVDAKEPLIILDVRDREEFESGHISNAANVSRGMLEFKVNRMIPDKNVKVIVYCSDGRRGSLATKTLSDLGYMNAVNIIGGIRAWKEAGYPTTKIDIHTAN